MEIPELTPAAIELSSQIDKTMYDFLTKGLVINQPPYLDDIIGGLSTQLHRIMVMKNLNEFHLYMPGHQQRLRVVIEDVTE